jgi:hypothetical protein
MLGGSIPYNGILKIFIDPNIDPVAALTLKEELMLQSGR